MKLHQEEKLLAGGPFLDSSGGMMVPVDGTSLEEIKNFAKADPAVKNGLLTLEIKPWMVAMEKEVAEKSEDIVFDLKLNVSAEEAWILWTDSKKLEKWLTTEANVDPKVGGPYELFWDPSNHSENSTLGCKITALVPYKLLAFEWRGPVPYADLMNVEPFPTWVSISIEAKSLNETVVHFRHSGWGQGDRWNEAKTWQKNAWSGAFSALEAMTKK
jgi:uncharacterized protein YndB with AHSA1/START domain